MSVGQHPLADPLNPPPAETKWIWKTFLILVGVTGVEFIFAFSMDRSPLLVSIFVILTLVKAYFIVGNFMHMGHEKKALVYSVIMPMLFIIWLIVVAIYEANHYYSSYMNFFSPEGYL